MRIVATRASGKAGTHTLLAIDKARGILGAEQTFS
jgi:hypothetical protein